MNTNQNLGKWTATIKNEGKTPQINVDGPIPTNASGTNYRLIKNPSASANPNELSLKLTPGAAASAKSAPGAAAGAKSAPGAAAAPGTTNSLHFDEALTAADKYKTVSITDEAGKTIANLNVISSQQSGGSQGQAPGGPSGTR